MSGDNTSGREAMLENEERMELRERITRQNEESVSTEPLTQEQPQTESAPQITHPSDTDPPSRPKRTGMYFALDKNDIFIVMVFSASDNRRPRPSTLLAGGMEQVDETTTDWRVFPGLERQVPVEPGAVMYLQPTVMTTFAVSPLPGYRRVGEPAPVAASTAVSAAASTHNGQITPTPGPSGQENKLAIEMTEAQTEKKQRKNQKKYEREKKKRAAAKGKDKVEGQATVDDDDETVEDLKAANNDEGEEDGVGEKEATGDGDDDTGATGTAPVVQSSYLQI
jgi:hypothetical protein